MPKGVYNRDPSTGRWKDHVKQTDVEKKAKAIKKTKEHNLANPTQARSTKLMKAFGITHEDYLDLKGSDECFICDKPCKTGRHLAIDHDHKLGHIRGLLCSNCNRGLGMFQDNLDLLVKATQYMTNYKEALEEING
jgi:hypothetical protein